MNPILKHPPRKHTAGNTPVLARIKRAFNGRIYMLALTAYNDRGADACREYLGRFYRDEYRAERLAELFDSGGETRSES